MAGSMISLPAVPSPRSSAPATLLSRSTSDLSLAGDLAGVFLVVDQLGHQALVALEVLGQLGHPLRGQLEVGQGAVGAGP